MNDDVISTVLQVTGAVVAVVAAAFLGGVWAALLVVALLAVALGAAW